MNKKRMWFAIISSLIFIGLIILTIVLWTKSDITKISEGDMQKIGNTQKYNEKNIDEITIKANVGKNTVVMEGIIRYSEDGDIKTVRYSSEWNREGFRVYTYKDGIVTNTWDENFKNKLKGGFVSLDREFVPMWQAMLIQLVPWLLIMGIAVFMIVRLSKMSGGMSGANPFSMGKNKARQIQSTVKFSDVAGINEEKTELVELVDYLKNPQKYSSMGARAPKGVLMEGPPGTGKTLLAKAVAGEAGVPFFSISGSEFEEMFVGVGASRIREMFIAAKKAAPCIIFIDEIDAVGRKRTVSIGSGANEQTLNQLLVEMDGFGTNTGVIVMAATNRVDVLDSALLRPGRFDRQIQISLPDINEREAILKLHARNKAVSTEVDFRRIAERTPGFSGAQLENVLNEAAILCVRKNLKIITVNIIDEAIDRVVGGPAKESRKYSVMDKDIVSYHEAGHALIGLRLESASKVQKVTIIPRGQAGGYTIMTPKEETMFHSKENLYATITGYLGGRASEEIIFGKTKITTGAHDDLEKATNIARHMVTEYGMSSLGLVQFESPKDEYTGTRKRYSEDIAAKIDTEVRKILDDCYVTAKALIAENLSLLDLIAESLKILETITAEQIEYIDKYHKLPDEVIREKERAAKHKEKKAKGEILEVKPKERKKDHPEDEKNNDPNKK
ncbi:ATP-dependent zinc metalloprotease FtsH [Spiroplasma citri]|uniref:ATP-dependent zinc metalloprotease FtsH n=1 Tax=Spiroplasma citri TaxID=2133 RepID=A0AAJ4JXF6_SPICI|nr:ATP-dependent zinc metalloprotease FtsH [Spiroplasma citri]APE73934.1 putative cell division protein FtsH [Spiroplasma citri]QED23965.1 ATP-dependent zinc metalloprotease FtsH [Spiroplasma citri]QIA66231.1 ATP-dependent zinc metalloprotease FtsH [Spiroplasma citri]QIA68083.1 ATP-dependent zinc metalloprotease FtsH [Spiroplasma citri]QIA69960.1 ATP-dependent zinc metalloprotease FtsH [Spiroplasma citri]